MYCDECGAKMREVGYCGEHYDEEHGCNIPIQLYQCPACNRVQIF
jgi:hypothetical protein